MEYIRELGSEFHEMPAECGGGIKLPRPGTLVFSGRTAIEAVLKKLPAARSVLLPSYCCDSMIVPFRKAAIETRFYDVGWNEGFEIKAEGTADILLWCNYFGFKNEIPAFDGVIIEDITHSFLSEQQYHEKSDYLVASIRKWEPLNCGGYCSVEAGRQLPPKEYIDLKTAAMKLKARYLSSHDAEEKQKYLQMFKESNHWLGEHYSGLSIDPASRAFLDHVDVQAQRRKRRQNAEALYRGLKDKVRFVFKEEKMDCPLFVPVLLPNRDEVRQKLISNQIYCPVHWPRPEGCNSNLYDRELSLICDQRYNEEDMEYQIRVLLASI